MCEQLLINVPEWFELNELSPLETIISPNSKDVGILLVGENFDREITQKPIVRLYLINLVEGQYEVTKELDSYTFATVEEATNFTKKLPTIKALDFILLLNKQQPIFA